MNARRDDADAGLGREQGLDLLRGNGARSDDEAGSVGELDKCRKQAHAYGARVQGPGPEKRSAVSPPLKPKTGLSGAPAKKKIPKAIPGDLRVSVVKK